MQVKEGYKQTEIGLIPDEWRVSLLKGLVTRMHQGINTAADKVEYRNEGFPIIQAKHMTSGKLTFDGAKLLSQADFERYKIKYRPALDNILFSNIGTIGKSTLILDDTDYLIAWNILLIDLKDDVESRYILGWLKRFDSIGYFSDLIAGNATKFINKGLMENILFPIPPLKEQQKIAEILSTLDAKLDAIDAEIEQTQTLKKGLMQTLLTQGIGHTQFKDSPLGQIPESWEVKTLGETGKAIIGLTYSPKDVVQDTTKTLVLRSSNIQKNQIVSKDNVYVEMDVPEKAMVQEGDILLCSRNGSKSLIGKSARIRQEHVGHSFGAFMTVYRSSFNDYIYHFFKTRNFFKQVESFMGATINQITSGSLNSMKIAIPPIEEQTQIANILSTVDDKIELLQQRKAETETLKKGLMQKLLTGEVRVKVA